MLSYFVCYLKCGNPVVDGTGACPECGAAIGGAQKYGVSAAGNIRLTDMWVHVYIK